MRGENYSVSKLSLKDGTAVELSNGVIQGDRISGDIVRTIPLSEITEAYDLKGNKLGNAKQEILKISRVKLVNNETVYILKIIGFEGGYIKAVVERNKEFLLNDVSYALAEIPDSGNSVAAIFGVVGAILIGYIAIVSDWI
jgi:hypothetical protein